MAAFTAKGREIESRKDCKSEFSSDFIEIICFAISRIPAKIHKIHSLEHECKLSLRWKTAESSEAKATAPKANATAKSFLILPSPATRKFSPTLPTPARLSFSPIPKSAITAPTPKTTKPRVRISRD